jgi:cyclopropane fatty-acyl-phospholipid synthase-like methyltransferase
MDFYDDKKNVDIYINMSKGYDGRWLIDELKKHLDEGSALLELGMGPGKDLDMLSKHYKVTGSDKSQVFIDLYRKKHPEARIQKIDAVKMNIDGEFDCIYSNKVLHHLTRNELKLSFENQHRVLTKDGILFHSFWYGDKEEEHNGLRFVYYTEETLQKAYQDYFSMVEFKHYSEFEKNDSFYAVFKKRQR